MGIVPVNPLLVRCIEHFGSAEGGDEPTATSRADRHRGLHQSYPVFTQAHALLLPADTRTVPPLSHRFRHPAALALCRFAAHLRHGERGDQAFRSASVAGWTSRMPVQENELFLDCSMGFIPYRL